MATLLIVEQDLPAARLIQGLVQRRFHDSVRAESSPEAIRLLSEDGPFHLVVATLTASDETALTFLDRLRSTPQWRDLPVILCSDHPQSVLVREAASLGVSAFVLKPIKPDHFLDTIDHALTSSVPVLHDHRQVQRELNIDLRRYQRLAWRIAQEIEHALAGLADTDGPLEGEIIESLRTLRDSVHSVGAYRARPPLDTALRASGDPAAALSPPVIRSLAAHLREVQAALLAVA